jgi:hypothetical protein
MRKKRSFRYFIIALLAMAGVAVLVPCALSYLSSVQDKGISIRTAASSEIWEMEGSFAEERWKDDNSSGIYIKNKSSRDLIIYFEYTGDLKQIFKHSDPVMVPAGTKTEVKL